MVAGIKQIRKPIPFGLHEWYKYFFKSKNKQQTKYFNMIQGHFRTFYSFLEKEQIMGKILDFLGIPNKTGKIYRHRLYSLSKSKLTLEKKDLNKLNIKRSIVKSQPNKTSKYNNIYAERYKGEEYSANYSTNTNFKNLFSLESHYKKFSKAMRKNVTFKPENTFCSADQIYNIEDEEILVRDECDSVLDKPKTNGHKVGNLNLSSNSEASHNSPNRSSLPCMKNEEINKHQILDLSEEILQAEPTVVTPLSLLDSTPYPNGKLIEHHEFLELHGLADPVSSCELEADSSNLYKHQLNKKRDKNFGYDQNNTLLDKENSYNQRVKSGKIIPREITGRLSERNAPFSPSHTDLQKSPCGNSSDDNQRDTGITSPCLSENNSETNSHANNFNFNPSSGSIEKIGVTGSVSEQSVYTGSYYFDSHLRKLDGKIVPYDKTKYEINTSTSNQSADDDNSFANVNKSTTKDEILKDFCDELSETGDVYNLAEGNSYITSLEQLNNKKNKRIISPQDENKNVLLEPKKLVFKHGFLERIPTDKSAFSFEDVQKQNNVFPNKHFERSKNIDNISDLTDDVLEKTENEKRLILKPINSQANKEDSCGKINSNKRDYIVKNLDIEKNYYNQFERTKTITTLEHVSKKLSLSSTCRNLPKFENNFDVGLERNKSSHVSCVVTGSSDISPSSKDSSTSNNGMTPPRSKVIRKPNKKTFRIHKTFRDVANYSKKLGIQTSLSKQTLQPSNYKLLKKIPQPKKMNSPLNEESYPSLQKTDTLGKRKFKNNTILSNNISSRSQENIHPQIINQFSQQYPSVSLLKVSDSSSSERASPNIEPNINSRRQKGEHNTISFNDSYRMKDCNNSLYKLSYSPPNSFSKLLSPSDGNSSPDNNENNSIFNLHKNVMSNETVFKKLSTSSVSLSKIISSTSSNESTTKNLTNWSSKPENKIPRAEKIKSEVAKNAVQNSSQSSNEQGNDAHTLIFTDSNGVKTALNHNSKLNISVISHNKKTISPLQKNMNLYSFSVGSKPEIIDLTSNEDSDCDKSISQIKLKSSQVNDNKSPFFEIKPTNKLSNNAHQLYSKKFGQSDVNHFTSRAEENSLNYYTKSFEPHFSTINENGNKAALSNGKILKVTTKTSIKLSPLSQKNICRKVAGPSPSEKRTNSGSRRNGSFSNLVLSSSEEENIPPKLLKCERKPKNEDRGKKIPLENNGSCLKNTYTCQRLSNLSQISIRQLSSYSHTITSPSIISSSSVEVLTPSKSAISFCKAIYSQSDNENKSPCLLKTEQCSENGKLFPAYSKENNFLKSRVENINQNLPKHLTQSLPKLHPTLQYKDKKTLGKCTTAKMIRRSLKKEEADSKYNKIKPINFNKISQPIETNRVKFHNLNEADFYISDSTSSSCSIKEVKQLKSTVESIKSGNLPKVASATLSITSANNATSLTQNLSKNLGYKTSPKLQIPQNDNNFSQNLFSSSIDCPAQSIQKTKDELPQLQSVISAPSRKYLSAKDEHLSPTKINISPELSIFKISQNEVKDDGENINLNKYNSREVNAYDNVAENFEANRSFSISLPSSPNSPLRKSSSIYFTNSSHEVKNDGNIESDRPWTKIQATSNSSFIENPKKAAGIEDGTSLSDISSEINFTNNNENNALSFSSKREAIIQWGGTGCSAEHYTYDKSAEFIFKKAYFMP